MLKVVTSRAMPAKMTRNVRRKLRKMESMASVLSFVSWAPVTASIPSGSAR